MTLSGTSNAATETTPASTEGRRAAGVRFAAGARCAVGVPCCRGALRKRRRAAGVRRYVWVPCCRGAVLRSSVLQGCTMLQGAVLYGLLAAKVTCCRGAPCCRGALL